MDYRERRSHGLGVYPTKDTSRMGTVRVKQEKEADTRIMQKSSKKSERKERGHGREKYQIRLNCYYYYVLVSSSTRDPEDFSHFNLNKNVVENNIYYG